VLPTLLYLVVCLLNDLWRLVLWVICIGDCGKQCKCYCKTVELDVEDGCPSFSEYIELAKQLEEELE
jgi:hypothetical protein